MTSDAPYDQLVFSGGGLRCFWHGGWMEAVGEVRDFAPLRITGVSGGALSAAAWIAGAETRLFDRFVRALRSQDDNVALDDLGPDDGRTPHQRVYSAIVHDVLDAEAQARIADGPAFQICVATPGGDGTGATLKSLAGGLAYEAGKSLHKVPRSPITPRVGLERRMIDARAAARDGRLATLVRQAATVPPAFRVDPWDGEAIFDGGMIDQAPLPEPDEGRTLVLLTRSYDALPDDPDRVDYVEPSSPVLEGAKLDFTDPDLLGEAWEEGARDGRTWLRDGPNKTHQGGD